ncbi:sugar phosphate nucleotidyltransferase [uncultured Sphaerochaeta sp.]|uniref:sugar phosphate nucleotidyltransferase n=1 Tax=uncultured Sphaerochaeta sp. TaxID=886478 RepID=UPI002A0A4595|nr:sugar phosphate nucleotidyltransferase [uncultured Sphaerochaeta sp.]
MHIILLSGGSGKRLWPLSNEARSKQFLPILQGTDGKPESMVQRVYRQIQEAGLGDKVTVAAGKAQHDSLRNQLGNSITIVLEPERRDTFPAIALSSAYLSWEKQIPLDEVVIVLPVDVYADLEYFKTLGKMEKLIKQGFSDLVLMGIEPDHPSEKYGYIVPGKKINGNQSVKGFVEKPEKTKAEALICEGACWNGGVFAFQLGYLMNILAKHTKATTYSQLYETYSLLKKISFDYEIVENATSIAMVPYKGKWKDLGTWDILATELGPGCRGKGLIAEPSGSTFIINELDIPIIALGTDDLVIAASPDGILVTSPSKSPVLKKYVDTISTSPRHEELLWGEYTIIDSTETSEGPKTYTKKVLMALGSFREFSFHKGSDTVIVVVKGEIEIQRYAEGTQKMVPLDTLRIKENEDFAIRSIKDSIFLEVHREV